MLSRTAQVAGVALVLSVTASFAGCGGGGGDGGVTPGSCVPGMVVACPCLGGAEGVQACSSEGTFSACACGAGSGGTGGSRAGGSGGGTGGSGGRAMDAAADAFGGEDTAPPADSAPVGTASLSVKVVDVSDSPIAQATVRVTVEGVLRGMATTADNGIAIVNGLVAGEYSVQASKTMFDSASKSASVAEGASADVGIQLIPSNAIPAGGTQRTEAIAIEAASGALVFEVDLFVLDRLGRPIDGLTSDAFSIEPFSDADTGETL